jgi:hypothetical protein
MYTKSRGCCCLWMLLVLLGVGLIGGSLFGYFVIAENQDREAESVKNLPVLSYTQYLDQPAGTRVMLTGTLSENGIVHDEHYPDMDQYGLVAYVLERWDVVVSNEGSDTGRWNIKEWHVPSLRMDYGDGTVVIDRPEPTAKLDITGMLHTHRVLDGTGSHTVKGIREGTLDVQGLKNGDLVTVLGTINANGAIVSQQIHAGSRAQLVALFNEKGTVTRYVCICLIGLGIFCLAVVFVIWLVQNLFH